MKNKFLFLIILLQTISYGQVVGTPYIALIDNRPLLDKIGENPSFAFSTRKLRESYTGFAVRIRRSSDNAEADVAFDLDNIVSDNSSVTIAVAGSSGLAVGNTLTLASFRNENSLYVSVWYDQGTNGFDALQPITSIQPEFSMASAGTINQYPSLLFTGLSNPKSVIVNQPMQVLLGNVTDGMGLRGTLGFIAKTTSNSNQFSLGYSTGSVRWSSHLNWSDGNCYVDMGDSNDIYRRFSNNTRLNIYKQYLFIRSNNTKTMRVSSASQGYNVVVNLNSGISGGAFGIGNSVVTPTASNIGFSGNIPELILFPEPLTLEKFIVLEYNQISFWGAY